MKILIIGNFSSSSTKEEVNGQTIKSDLVYQALKNLNYSLEKINTKDLSVRILLKKIKEVDKIIFMLGINGMRFLFPILFLFSKIYKKDMYYIVIGGWLDDFVKKNKIHKFLLLNIKKILVECSGMKVQLEKRNFKNIEVLYNFKNIIFKIEEDYKLNSKNFNIVFFSRIIREKGIFELIEAIKQINNISVNLDIWGPLDLKDEEKYFFSLIEKSPNIKYKNILKKNIYKTLNKYDLLIFPTYYSGEGQAGVIIDSFIANVPILASNWKYNKEFIIDGKTGFLYDINAKGDLIEKINFILKNKEKLLVIRKNIQKEKEKYTEEVFQKKISEILGE